MRLNVPLIVTFCSMYLIRQIYETLLPWCQGPATKYQAITRTKVNSTEWETKRRGTHCSVPATAHFISTLELPVHMLQDSQRIFVHRQCFAIISRCLHIYKQALIVYHVLHNLPGTLKDAVASTFVDLLSFQVNIIKVISLL